jgi:hypothetical protein
MLPLLNIKLMDTFVFVAGFSLGIVPGIIVANLTWLIYGTLNPLGFSLPTLLSVMIGESCYAVVGWMVSRYMFRKKNLFSIESSIIFGLAGLLATLAYDVFTNAVTGWLFYNSIVIGLLTMNFPLPMGLLHEISNLILFAVVSPLLLRAFKIFWKGDNSEFQ